MAEQGMPGIQTGQPIMGKGSDGKAYLIAADPTTGQLIVQLAAGASIDIGAVSLIGDDAAVITGSKSDAAWDGAAAAPTWTAIWKYIASRVAGTLTAAIAATAAAGGIPSTGRLLSAANTTNGTNVKASAGRIYSIQGYNAAAAVRWLKLYNKATTPTVGTDTPVKTIAIPASTVFAFDWPVGYSFATGIGFGLTTGSADADTGALTAGDILGLNIDYA